MFLSLLKIIGKKQKPAPAAISSTLALAIAAAARFTASLSLPTKSGPLVIFSDPLFVLPPPPMLL